MNSPNPKSTPQRFTSKLTHLFFHSPSVPSQIFFSLLFLREIGLFNAPQTTYALFTLGLLFLLLSCYNHFLLYSGMLTLSVGGLGLYNVLVGLLGANERWRLYLFCFVAVYYLQQESYPFTDTLIIVLACLICVQTYRSLIFPTLRTNLAQFTCFFTLAFLRLFKASLLETHIYELNSIELICITPAIVLLGFTGIRMRVRKMQCCQPGEIRDAGVFAIYVQAVEEGLEDGDGVVSYLLMHRKQCVDQQCYCHSYPQQSIPNLPKPILKTLKSQILETLHTSILQSQPWPPQSLTRLLHNYILFLLESHQLPKAMQLLSELSYEHMDYFNKAMNYRVREFMGVVVGRGDYFRGEGRKLGVICGYDRQVGYLVREIREILFMKVQLWKELCKQNSLLKHLQSTGSQLVHKIESLHKTFLHSIRPSEQILSQFKATLIYATYLTFTTNYTEYANSLAKKTQKFMEESKSQIKCAKEFGLFLRVCANWEIRRANLFELLVANCTAGFCDLLGWKKEDLLFKNISELIPEYFQQLHTKKFDKFIKNPTPNPESCQFFSSPKKLPFKISQEQVIFLDTFSTLHYDYVDNSVMILCILKKSENNRTNLILDLEGKLMYYETDLFKEVIGQDRVREGLVRLEGSWKKGQQMETINENILLNDNNLFVELSPMFACESKKIGTPPLVKLQIKSDALKAQKIRHPNFALTNRIKSIEVLQSKQIDSQSSNSSRKDSIQNVLTLLMRSSSLKLQIFLVLILFLMTLSFITTFQICNNFFNTWNTGEKEKNPVFTEINFIDMRRLINSALSWNYDIVRYTQDEPATVELYRSLYGGDVDIDGIGRGRLMGVFEDLVKIMDDYILGFDNQVSLLLEKQLSKQLIVQSPNPDSPAQSISLHAILTNYMVQIYNLAQNEPSPGTMLSSTYTAQVHTELTQISNKINQILSAESQATLRNNYIIISFVSFVLLLFLVPIWRFNIDNKKKHEKIYTLLASLEPKLILDEIGRLEKIQAEIATVYDNVDQRNTYSNLELPSSRLVEGKRVEKKQEPTGIQAIYEGISKLTAEQIAIGSKPQTRTKIRKRVGEVTIEGSNCDKKKLRKMDAILLLFLFAFLSITHTLVWHKIRYINQMNDQMRHSLEEIQYVESSSLGLLNSKIYSDQYGNGNVIFFQGKDLGGWMRDWLLGFDGENMEIQVESCSQNILLCKSKYSLTVLQGFIKKFITDSYESSTRNQTSPHSPTPLSQKIRFQLIFAEQLLTFLIEDKTKALLTNFTQSEEQERQHTMEKMIIGIVFYAGVIGFVVFAVLYTVWVKRNYVREVTLLSILNKEMLYNNKRVESFLQKLSKSS